HLVQVKHRVTKLQLQKLQEENLRLKVQLVEERNIANLFNSFIVKILELHDGERRMRDMLKEMWMQLLRTQENEQNLRKLQMASAQVLEAKLAAAELYVVELKIEVDDLRARLKVLNLNSPSHMGKELQSLRSQCDHYKKEIDLLMEQVPTAEQEADKRNEIAKIWKENMRAQLRLQKLERQISHVKKWRKELRRLKEVDRERDALLSRLEVALKRNRNLQQELVMLKQKSAHCTTSRASSKPLSPEKSRDSQNVAGLEASVFVEGCEEGANEAFPWKEQTNKEFESANIQHSSSRLQMRPPLKIIDVN
ncbi:hypothetical protein KI387_007112, partial [Taxus chinensis]